MFTRNPSERWNMWCLRSTVWVTTKLSERSSRGPTIKHARHKIKRIKKAFWGQPRGKKRWHANAFLCTVNIDIYAYGRTDTVIYSNIPMIPGIYLIGTRQIIYRVSMSSKQLFHQQLGKWFILLILRDQGGIGWNRWSMACSSAFPVHMVGCNKKKRWCTKNKTKR